MRAILIPVIGCLAIVALHACKKSSSQPASDNFCDELVNVTTVRSISMKLATIQKTGDEYYVIEENTIDTRLRPCYLPEELRVDKLQVVVTGEVKKTNHSAVCCTDELLVIKITPR
ncbi:MAG: hypothetical protein QM731_04380 [Chitinophagaceae bacterium]